MSQEPTRARGHLPTLIACFLHFDFSFMIWVLLGSLGIFVAESAGLSDAQKGWMVAIPILSGSLLRVPVGLLADRIGGKRVGVALLALLMVPLAIGWLGPVNTGSLFSLGLLLGIGGASFAVALPLASRWYPPERQGLAMGVAAAGNSGTVITHLLAPRLAESFGWKAVFGLAMIPLALVLVCFALLARESPRAASAIHDRGPAMWRRVLSAPDLWWLCLFYAVTFGGYVGLGSFLPLLFRDQFQVEPVTAGQLAAAVTLAGSISRPIGGIVADRVGGAKLLGLLLFAVGGTYAIASGLPTLTATVVMLLVGMVFLGMGNGAVFQIVPRRFPREVGVVTGVIGAVGGLGGFLVPILLGTLKGNTGSFAAGFVGLALLALTAAVRLRTLCRASADWRGSWGAEA
ncbi:MAG: MFS transporter [Myxococcaceae bacterium]